MNLERVYTTILASHVSEKSTNSIKYFNQYVFKVSCDANKFEIRKSIEHLFSVKVYKVQILKIKGKIKRNRYGIVKRSNWKKAVVRLSHGQEINLSNIDKIL